MDIEHRTLVRELRLHEPNVEGSIGTLEGYAALFNVRSELLGFFFEEIAQGAFDDVMDDDVRALYDHDSARVLGRTSSKTMNIETDDRGLRYSVALPDTTEARDLKTLVERGDIRESSFGFMVAPRGDEWVMDDEGRTIRTITKINRLFDVSPVAFPAYQDTSVAVRRLDAMKKDGKVTNRNAPAFELKANMVDVCNSLRSIDQELTREIFLKEMTDRGIDEADASLILDTFSRISERSHDRDSAVSAEEFEALKDTVTKLDDRTIMQRSQFKSFRTRYEGLLKHLHTEFVKEP